MSQDDVISKLMDETFDVKPSHSRTVTNPDSDFHIMTQISRLPVTAIRGRHLSRGFYEFLVAGLCLHIPLDHLDQNNSKALMSVLGHHLQDNFDRITLVSSSQATWLFVWNSFEQVSEADIHKIFTLKSAAKAA